MVALFCCGVAGNEGSEKEMLCMRRLFCAEASVCGYTRFGGEVEGIISRSFRVGALLAAECLISAVDDVLGECHRVNVFCMSCYCQLNFSGHV